MNIHIKRAYEEPSDIDCVRILVDRLWPRGVSKQKLRLDYWMKQLAPSNELRKWFNHDPDKFEQFKALYKREIFSNPDSKEAFLQLVDIVNKTVTVTLVYGAKDTKHNQAVVLREVIKQHIKEKYKN